MRHLSLLAAVALLTACGGSDPAPPPTPLAKTAETAPGKAPATSKPAASKPQAATNSLSIEATDMMKFSASTLSAAAGKPITLQLNHVGKLDKSMMGHNWVLLAQGTDVQAFTMAAIDAKDTGYIPAGMKDQVLAATKLLGGGESDTITFTVDAPGTYVFICSFPGHSALMKGELVVTEG